MRIVDNTRQPQRNQQLPREYGDWYKNVQAESLINH